MDWIKVINQSLYVPETYADWLEERDDKDAWKWRILSQERIRPYREMGIFGLFRRFGTSPYSCYRRALDVFTDEWVREYKMEERITAIERLEPNIIKLYTSNHALIFHGVSAGELLTLQECIGQRLLSIDRTSTTRVHVYTDKKIISIFHLSVTTANPPDRFFEYYMWVGNYRNASLTRFIC